MPGSLHQAFCLLEKNDVVKASLGEHIYQEFMMAKTIEWDKYRTIVTKWEEDMYLATY